MKGIVLIAIGGNSYAKWAINMAASCKYYSPNLPIQILCSQEHAPELQATGFFDVLTVLEPSDYQSETGALFPAKIKTRLYDFLAYDESIYLDVDGILIKDITPVFETKADLACDIQGVYDATQGNEFHYMKWCKPNVVWAHYGLNGVHKMPAINSSFLFIRKSDLNKKLFAQAYDNLMNKPIPTEKHWYVWGKQKASKVCQPDELYVNVAMAQLGIIPEHLIAVYFRMINDYGENKGIEAIRENFYAIGLFGQYRTNHITVREMYEKEMKRIAREMNIQLWKGEVLSKSKFVII